MPRTSSHCTRRSTRGKGGRRTGEENVSIISISTGKGKVPITGIERRRGARKRRHAPCERRLASVLRCAAVLAWRHPSLIIQAIRLMHRREGANGEVLVVERRLARVVEVVLSQRISQTVMMRKWKDERVWRNLRASSHQQRRHPCALARADGDRRRHP